MTQRSRALVVGGSVGGLIAAHLLRAIGWHVVVFERSTEELADRGAAIGLTQELIDVMPSSILIGPLVTRYFI